MQVRYGPNVDEARIIPEPEDEDTLRASVEAGYALGTLIGAHSPDSGFAEMFFRVQVEMRELAGLTNMEMEEGFHIDLDVIFATAMACMTVGELRDRDEIRDAGLFWCGVVREIRDQTEPSAMQKVTSPSNDVPSNPWKDT